MLPIIQKSDLIRRWINTNVFVDMSEGDDSILVFRNENKIEIASPEFSKNNSNMNFLSMVLHNRFSSLYDHCDEELLEYLKEDLRLYVAVAYNRENSNSPYPSLANSTPVDLDLMASGCLSVYKLMASKMQRLGRWLVPSEFHDALEIEIDYGIREHLPLMYIDGSKIHIQARAIDAAVFPEVIGAYGLHGAGDARLNSFSLAEKYEAGLDELLTALIGNLYSTLSLLLWTQYEYDPSQLIDPNRKMSEDLINYAYAALNKARSHALFIQKYEASLEYLEASVVNDIAVAENVARLVRRESDEAETANILRYVSCAGRVWMDPAVVDEAGGRIDRKTRKAIDAAFSSMPFGHTPSLVSMRKPTLALAAVLAHLDFSSHIPNTEKQGSEEGGSKQQRDESKKLGIDNPFLGPLTPDPSGDEKSDGGDNSSAGGDKPSPSGKDPGSLEGQDDSPGVDDSSLNQGKSAEQDGNDSKPEHNAEPSHLGNKSRSSRGAPIKEYAASIKNILANESSMEEFDITRELEESILASMSEAEVIGAEATYEIAPRQHAIDSRDIQERQLNHIIATCQPGWHYGQKHGELHFDDYVASRGMDEKIFTDYRTARNPFAAEMVVLVDLSYSMGDLESEDSILDAYEGAWALAASVGNVDMPVHVICYGDNDNPILYNPESPAKYDVMRAFREEDYSSENIQRGGTNPKRALQSAAQIFERSEKPIKLLVTLTDGAWSTPVSRSYGGPFKKMDEMNVKSLLIFLSEYSTKSTGIMSQEQVQKFHKEYYWGEAGTTHEDMGSKGGALYHNSAVCMDQKYFESSFAEEMFNFLTQAVKEHEETIGDR